MIGGAALGSSSGDEEGVLSTTESEREKTKERTRL